MLLRSRLQARDLEDRGVEVHPDRRAVARVRLGHSRPRDRERLADAPFPLAALAAAKREAAGRIAVTRRDTAVVRREDHDRVALDARLTNRIEDEPHGVVEGRHHAGVDRMVLHLPHLLRAVECEPRLGPRRESETLSLVAKRAPAGLPTLDRRVHVIEREHREERRRAGGRVTDERRGVAGEPMRKLRAGRIVVEPRVAIGREESAGRRAEVPAPLVDLVALILGRETLAAEVPLACEERAVAVRAERLGDRHLLERQLRPVGRGQQLRVPLPLRRLVGPVDGDVVGDAESCRCLARLDRRA